MTELNSIDRDSYRKSDPDRTPDPQSTTNPILWSVNVSDRDVIDLTHAELVERVRDGRLPVTTFIWRDGMEEWQALDQFAEFESLVRASRGADSGLHPRDDLEPLSDNLSGPPTPRRMPHRRIQQTLPGIDDGAALDKDDRDEANDLAPFEILAVYERPLATLEFATSDAEGSGEEKNLPSDALTPTNPTPLRRRQRAALEPATGAKTPPATARQAPSLPPLPPRPTPKAPPLKRADAEALRADEVAAAPPPALPGADARSSTTAAVPEPTAAPSAAASTAAVAPAPAAATAPTSPEPSAAAPAAAASAARSPNPARPALTSLPPIIVREAQASELVTLPAPARHDEATLVLARRKTRRWVPLRAAIVSAFGSACLASVLTWAIVRPARPAPGVAKAAAAPVTAAAPTPAPEATPGEANAAAAAPLAVVEATKAPPAPTEAPATKQAESRERKAVTEPSRSVSDAPSGKKSAEAPRTEPNTQPRVTDPGLTDPPKSAAKPDASVASAPGSPPVTRAGWPYNPGF
jgi:hypothetical protein